MSVITTNQGQLSRADFDRVRNVICRHCGIDLHEGKQALVTSRLSKRVREGGYRSFTEYIDLVLPEQGQREFHLLVDAISTNLTSVFRENKHFDFFTQKHLPNILARNAAVVN